MGIKDQFQDKARELQEQAKQRTGGKSKEQPGERGQQRPQEQGRQEQGRQRDQRPGRPEDERRGERPPHDAARGAEDRFSQSPDRNA
ncbi:hypothetical protein ACIBCM_27850 [Streptomyces sp. NPDC051018]|uniref:hypothetical protein n=1 Tax=Streptomyces sp. NPDC051018 TaxID=3365639 RepID=UPI0037A6F524